MTLTKKGLFIVFGITASILLIPLVAMQFTTEVNWGGMDFIVAAALLLSFGTLILFAFQKIRRKTLRFAVAAIIFIALLLIWAELAVGIFGSPFGGN